jgi:hypothetical protein
MSDTHDAGGPGLFTFVAFALAILPVALVADLLQPLGPFALVLAAAFAVLALVAGVLTIVPPTRGLFGPLLIFSLISLAAFGGVFGLQRFAEPESDGVRNGFFTTVLPPARGFQQILLREAPRLDGRPPVAAGAPMTVAPAAAPTPVVSEAAPMDEKRKALLTALASADPAVRLRGGIAALNERDPATLAGVIDTLYRSPDPAIRQLAVKRLIAQRRGARMPLLATPASPDAQALANALQAAGLTVRTINETSGAFDGGLCGPAGMTGAVNRSGVTMSGRCKVGDADAALVLVLAPTDDFQLAGEARDDKGRVARVQLPLM